MEYSRGNTMTRKEYLKSKKKNKIEFSKFKYILLFLVVILLGIYVFKQLKIYNNVTQIANKVVEESKLTKTMTMYYVSNTYTKDGNSTVMLYKSYDESRTSIPGTENLSSIVIDDTTMYGLIDNSLYGIKLTDYNKKEVCSQLNNRVEEYFLKGNEIYIRTSEGIYKYNLLTEELKEIIKSNSCQMNIDNDSIYIIREEKNNRKIIKYDLNGNNEKQISESYPVESMTVLDNCIYFVNSKDFKIYIISKSDGKIKRLINNESQKTILKYSDNIYYINSSNNNTLYSFNLKTGEEEQVTNKSIESMQLDRNVIYYKLTNGLGIYKLDLDTKNTTQITSIRTSEYLCMN